MRINSIQPISPKRSDNGAGVCLKDNQESGRMKNSAVSFNGLYGTKAFGKLMEKCDTYEAAIAAAAGLVFASVLRPITIMSLPGQKKNKEDKFYASTHAISSGLMGFLVTTALTAPLSDRIKLIKEDPIKYGFKTLAGQDAATVKRLTTIMKNIPEWFIAVPRSMMTVALIPVIQKYVFGVQKNKKTGQVEPMVFADKPVFAQFRGKEAK